MKVRSIKTAGILIVIAAAIACVAFWLFLRNPMYDAATETDKLSRPAIEHLGGFKFPANAANVHSRYVEWLDYDLWVRFDLPPAARDELIASLVTAPTTDMTMGGTDTDSRMPWWTPPTGDGVEELNRRGRGVWHQIILDGRDPKSLVVYVSAHNDGNVESPSTAPATSDVHSTDALR